jgi:aminoglycoside N3'-acetyltransferase
MWEILKNVITLEELTEQLCKLGIETGNVLLVHTSFSKVAPVEGGPFGLIAALQNVVGSEGTLVMPSMTADDEHPNEIDHCCENFNHMDGWLDAEQRQRYGIVGHAQARLVRARDIIATALDHLRKNETVFLHPSGVCIECDEARASLLLCKG